MDDKSVEAKSVNIQLEPFALDVDRAAQMLAISKRLLWAKTKDGTIPHFKLGNRTLYSVTELRNWTIKQSRENHNLFERNSDG